MRTDEHFDEEFKLQTKAHARERGNPSRSVQGTEHSRMQHPSVKKALCKHRLKVADVCRIAAKGSKG